MNIDRPRVARSATAFLAAALLGAAGCANVPRVPGLTPHKIDIQQGNFVSQEMVDKLKPGMSKDQVRFILGTPLVTDIFHADRWDYVYYHLAPSGRREQRRMAVYFSDGKLTRVDGDVMPAEPGGGDRAPRAVEWDRGEPPSAPPLHTKPSAPLEEKPAAQPASAQTPAPEKPTAEKPAAEKPAAEEKGFFGRLRDRLGL
jgi:outer membrane protein assembly factor BamE